MTTTIDEDNNDGMILRDARKDRNLLGHSESMRGLASGAFKWCFLHTKDRLYFTLHPSYMELSNERHF